MLKFKHNLINLKLLKKTSDHKCMDQTLLHLSFKTCKIYFLNIRNQGIHKDCKKWNLEVILLFYLNFLNYRIIKLFNYYLKNKKCKMLSSNN